MKDFGYLISNFFTHKDFLAPAKELPGTLFTPLHIIVSVLLFSLIVTLAIILSKKGEKTLKKIFIIVFILAIILEPTKIIWESVTGKTVALEVGGVLPFYPCSVFMFALPFAIWGNQILKKSACGYICTMGLIGALINFVYPVNVISRYSCLSFAGFHTLFFHGSMLFVALIMLISNYHRYTKVTKWYELFLPALPLLVWSIPANILNLAVGSDYMYFKANSFPFSSIIGSLPDFATTLIMYVLYILVPLFFYLPSYIKNKTSKKTVTQESLNK